MSYLSNLYWESSPWCRLGILAPFRLRQVQEVRLEDLCDKYYQGGYADT